MTENNNKSDEPKLREISDEELKEILAEHKKWVESNEKDGKRADLSHADLKGKELREANLEQGILIGANLTNANLCRANLYRAGLQNAILQNAILEEAYLWEANLEQAILIGANLLKADLTRANLQEVIFGEANLQKASLFGANLQNSDLQISNLTQAIIIGANLANANLYRADLQTASLSRANFQEASLFGANLQGASLESANFENANVAGIKYNRKGKYQGIRVETCFGSARFKRFAQDHDFIEELRGGKWPERIIYYLWNVFADCGRTPWSWLAWSILFALYFGCIFFMMGPDSFEIKTLIGNEFITYIYYSVVTLTTLGFGDIIPKTAEAAKWVIAEVILSYIIFGGLISILVTKLARRS